MRVIVRRFPRLGEWMRLLGVALVAILVGALQFLIGLVVAVIVSNAAFAFYSSGPAWVPLSGSSNVSLTGEWQLDSESHNISIAFTEQGEVVLTDWPADVLCPEVRKQIRGWSEIDWSRTVGATGRAEPSTRGPQVGVRLTPNTRGCSSGLTLFLEEQTASGELRLIYYLNGPTDSDEGVMPLVFRRTR